MLAGTYASKLHFAGIEAFKLSTCMSLHCFYFLLCCLQFDNKATRAERKKVDNLAAVRQLFDMFVKNCKKKLHSIKICDYR